MRPHFLFFVLAALPACGPVFYDDAVRTVARDQMQCAPSDITIEDLGSYQYRADGCGQRAKYACTSGHASPVCVRMGAIESAAVTPQTAHQESPSPLQEEPQNPSADSAIAQSVRAFLDAHRADVLACVGRDLVAIHASWSRGSPPNFTLVGALTNTPEERCAREVLIGFTASPASSYDAVLLVRTRQESAQEPRP